MTDCLLEKIKLLEKDMELLLIENKRLNDEIQQRDKFLLANLDITDRDLFKKEDILSIQEKKIKDYEDIINRQEKELVDILNALNVLNKRCNDYEKSKQI